MYKNIRFSRLLNVKEKFYLAALVRIIHAYTTVLITSYKNNINISIYFLRILPEQFFRFVILNILSRR